ncbi:hypothetical protein SAY87_014759 [Trapa incisa]|uniref:Wound-induced protein 1 n=1 Tax=Trapa incisa TaxID=236973 RepID=A0AAN7GW36_9MYRT|nr:hypothetical protein SAY87_014759 [Trapa incisa]
MSTNYRDHDDDAIVEHPLPPAGIQAIKTSDDPKPEEETAMRANTTVVHMLYEALSRGDTDTMSGLLASDLEWWFHGPPRCQHMMRLLTGECTLASSAFRFEPRGVTAVGPAYVIAEGWEGAQAYWVHVWTVKDGLITQFREYFNTWLTVRDTTRAKWPVIGWGSGSTGPVSRSTLWQSQPRDLCSRSLPGLLLAM